ncbi:LLM class flavin-dependent oxidoreductase [Actinoplanes auranticolor]|uniref:Luciferase n=1 Tax=Actinoplanes auranticolor TaxID=47988 RepID=A0A919W5I6_9ACTN|nr:LLM class flavin-dependent oxidoreductase [Actinoplanes auranticolor]GIM80608.1 luciferase [Actinoplanes auranticolor]
MAVQIGVATLTDLPAGADPRARMQQIVDLGVRADDLGLDVFGVGEHHSADFLVSSPVPVLAAVAARTRTIRLSSAVTVLSVHDPVRVYQDFATLDLLSGGRAEIVTGRSAYPDPFALFGVDITRYDEMFVERLDLLLRLRDGDAARWSGRHRPPVVPAAVVPRAVQDRLPVWIGAGGSPGSVERAGAAGLPLILGYIGGTPAHVRQLIDLYRAAGERAGHAERLQVGVAVHYYAGDEPEKTYGHYRDFLRPKGPGRPGFTVSPQDFADGLRPDGHLMIGTTEQVTEKMQRLHKVVAFDRVQALVDWGGISAERVRQSLDRLGTDISPALRAL